MAEEMAMSWASALAYVWASPAVTVVGANETGGTTGLIVTSLTRPDSLFRGKINMVSRNGGSVYGFDSVPSIRDVEGELGIVWLLLNRSVTLQVLEGMSGRLPRAVIVFAGGFAEVGNFEAQSKLTKWSETHGVPLFGPQSIGFLSPVHGVNVLDGKPRGTLRPGRVALISQSGGILWMMINGILSDDRGFHSAFSLGGEAALNYANVGEALIEDSDVSALGLYVENLGSLTRFARLAQRAAETGKPLVALAAGNSDRGQRLAASHTGAMATPKRLVQGIADQFGTVLVANVDELISALDGLETSQFRRWGTGRVGFFTGSGGMAITLSDQISDCGIPAPQPSRETVAALFGGGEEEHIANPYDFGAGLLGRPDEYARRVGTFLADGGFDIGVHVFDVPDTSIEPHVYWVEEGIRLARMNGLHPMLAAGVDRLERSGRERYGHEVTIGYGFDDTLTKLAAIGTWSRGESGEACVSAPPAAAGGRTLIASAKDVRAMLAGVPLRWPEEWLVERGADIEAALTGASFPLVAKAEVGLAHRGRAGAVLTRVPDISAAVGAVTYLQSLFDSDVTLAQSIAFRDEFFVGLSRTPEGHATIAVGPGGSAVEDNDIGFRLLPLSARHQDSLLDRYAPKAQGHPGFVAVLDALIQVMESDRIAAIDLNPVVVDEAGAVWALDAKIHIYERDRTLCQP
jgi:acetate---CoA ligase (ADP-forming)